MWRKYFWLIALIVVAIVYALVRCRQGLGPLASSVLGLGLIGTLCMAWALSPGSYPTPMNPLRWVTYWFTKKAEMGGTRSL